MEQELLDCQGLDTLDLDYWDVMPKSARVNCSREDITFPLTVYGVERGSLEYRVLNGEIASVNEAGEVTLGRVRGVTMLLAWRKSEPCDLRYVQLEVECPCDEFLPTGGCFSYTQTGCPWSETGCGAYYQTGDWPDADCSDCARDCDGAPSLTLIVSGFTGMAQGNNGTYVLERVGVCDWRSSDGTARVWCHAGRWRVEVALGDVAYAVEEPAALLCAGDRPTGSGTLFCPAFGETGYYSIG